jgi:hypothetical protein
MFAHVLIAFPLVPLALAGLKWRDRVLLSIIVLGYVAFITTTFTDRGGRAIMPMGGPYSMLGWYHLTEVFVYLVASCGWIVIATPKWGRIDRVVLCSAAGGAIMLLMVCPMAGVLRYFDTMGMAVIPCVLLAVSAIEKLPWRSWALAATVTGGFLLFNTSPRHDWMLSIMETHPAYRPTFQDGHQQRVTAFIYHNELGDNAAAMRIMSIEP